MFSKRDRSVLALLVFLIPAVVGAQEKSAEPKRSISVTGQGEVKAAPDRVLLSFAVETTAAKATEAAAENAKRSAAVAAAVKHLLDPKDVVTTTRYMLDPRYEAQKPGGQREPRIIGYVARNEVQVESRKIDAVGALIDAAIDTGANRISGLQFELSHRDEALQEAIEKAAADARMQAAAVAKGIGVRLKGVLSATTSSQPIPMPRHFGAFGMAAAEARVPTSIEPGQVSVNATLQVTYEIE
jgi:uncharacterized protein